MAPSQARVTSIDAIRSLRTGLAEFGQNVADAIASLEREARRPLEWIEHDRARYWPREVRRGSDAVGEARNALERCELSSSPGDHRSCFEERKQVEQANRRLELAEAKVQLVHQWRHKLRKEVEEFLVQAAKMKHYLEHDLPNATAQLDRLLEALDRYVQSLVKKERGNENL